VFCAFGDWFSVARTTKTKAAKVRMHSNASAQRSSQA
jgi:hypothetical protein